MDKLKNLLRKMVSVILVTVVLASMCGSSAMLAAEEDISESVMEKTVDDASETEIEKIVEDSSETEIEKTVEDVSETEIEKNVEDVSETENLEESEIDIIATEDNLSVPESAEFEDNPDILGSGDYGKDLNRQGYQVQVTSYVNGVKKTTFKEGILRYYYRYAFCYDPNKRFKETDNVTLHAGNPPELTREQGKTIALMIYYITEFYDISGPEGAMNYYLGQCAIWNYINSVNPSFSPYKMYITDSLSPYSIEDQDAFYTKMLNWVNENKDNYETTLNYCINNDGDYQPVLFGDAKLIKKGHIEINKKSDNETLTKNNDNYSLEGAVYGVYLSENNAKSNTGLVTSITTDASGKGTSKELDYGTYYVREITAPRGYTLDTKVYKVAVNDSVNANVVSSLETPGYVPISLILTKKDDESDDYFKKLYLEGAIYEVKFFASNPEGGQNNNSYIRHWYIKTDSEGKAYLNSKYLTSFNGISGDSLFLNNNNETILPFGYITFQEVEAPKGYILDSRVTTVKVEKNMNDIEKQNQRIVTNHEKRQAFQIVKLAEDDSAEKKPLANAGFMACRLGDLSTDESGNYVFDEKKAVNLASDGTKEMFTNKEGYALSAELRYGTYLVRETTVPIGYMPVADFYITISEDNRTPQKILYKTDKAKKYYLRVTKIDSTTKMPVLNNSSSYKIWSYKDNDYISFKTYTGSEYNDIDEFMTDDNGILITPGTLTYGNYKLIETSAPVGYNIDNPEGIDFSIDDNTIYTTTENEGDTAAVVDIAYSDTPIYCKLSLSKTGEIREFDEEKKEFIINEIPLENIEFGLYANEDIYTLDNSGKKLYEKGDLVYSLMTDDEGKASQGDIPLGNYFLKELNTPDDFVGLDDVEIKFNAEDENSELNGIYYIDKSIELLNKVYYPKIKTTAADISTNDHIGVIGEKTTIVDKVDCTDLVVGRRYTIKGKLYDTATGEVYTDIDGEEVASEIDFTAEKENQIVDLEFTFNSLESEGETVTVFEELYYDGKMVAMHSDISDTNQQVQYPHVKTTAKDKNTNGHTGVISENVTIIDSVECTNLIVGKEYTVKGKLYNSETGEVFLDDQKEVTAENTFTADKKDMTVCLEFNFNSTSLEGATIVVFEDLYHKDIKIDSHARLDDKEQQVHYPKIGTTAKNAADGGKVSAPNKKVTLNDTVDISNVDIGEDLILRGVVYDKSTGEKLLVEGKEVWSSSEFTSIDNNMKTDVVFTFDASELAGKSVVLYEYMYIKDEQGSEVLVASHEDINYEGQTIIFSDEPKTGDRNILWIVIAMTVSGLGIGLLIFKNIKIKKS